jgi:hypothetical protein
MIITNNLSRIFTKLMVTARDFKKTAYHHYGKSPLSLLKFLYYSAIRINTFLVYQADLDREFPELAIDNNYRVIKPTLRELARIREGNDLPREFYYDELYNVKTCYLVFKDDELAYIHWVFIKGDYNRFLKLSDGVAELNYNTTLPKFRGNRLQAKMVAYICKDLKKNGYSKVVGVTHESNIASIKSIERAGWKEIARIKAFGIFHRKVKV